MSLEDEYNKIKNEIEQLTNKGLLKNSVVRLSIYNVLSFNSKDRLIYLYNLTPKPSSIDIGYYFQINDKLTFPRYLQGKFILFKIKEFFPSKNSLLGDKWESIGGDKPSEYTGLYTAEVINIYNNEADLIKQSKLHGFNEVIDDNNYYSAIPEVNELWHWDNGIIYRVKYEGDFTLNSDPNKWYDIELNVNRLITEGGKIIMLNQDHCNPER